MSERRSFYRKISYLAIIAVLLFPISQLGAPSTLEDEGGTLARIRSDPQYNLGQANLGDIDPASETMRLATMGLRGIAVSLLWSKANDYKKKEDWTNFRATLSQLSKLQPYFISFWRYQAWNLTYNVSVEVDDVRDRYHYVKRGIEFLKEGIKYNRDNPTLLADIGWFVGNKIGRADEHEQYRRMFKLDDDFHPADRPPELRDNWLVSKKWYEDSISAVDDKKKDIGNKNPTTFYEKPARAQINYSEAIEEEGAFGEKARAAWATAQRLWNDYGNRALRSSRGIMIQLNSLERIEAETVELREQLEALAPEARAELTAERRENLTEKQLEALELPDEQLDDQQRELRSEARQQLELTPSDFVKYLTEKSPDLAPEARRLATHIAENESRLFLIRSNRQVANYEYWETRCEFEQTPAALRARELAYAGQRAFRDGDLFGARRLYEESFDAWVEVIDEFPSLQDDSTTGSDIVEYIDQYAAVLEQLELTLADEEIDKHFPLWDVLETHDVERKFTDAINKHQSRQSAE